MKGVQVRHKSLRLGEETACGVDPKEVAIAETWASTSCWRCLKLKGDIIARPKKEKPPKKERFSWKRYMEQFRQSHKNKRPKNCNCHGCKNAEDLRLLKLGRSRSRSKLVSDSLRSNNRPSNKSR